LIRLAPLRRRTNRLREVGVVVLHHGNHVRGHPVGRAQLEPTTGLVKHVDDAGIGVGKLRGFGHNGVEDSLQVERRVNRLGDFAEGAQLLYRLGKFAGAGLHFFEQPYVFDRDHRLVGKGADQLDLLFCERLDLRSRKDHHPYKGALTHQRDAKHGPLPAHLLPVQLLELRIG
jgi:hypothetical protein